MKGIARPKAEGGWRCSLCGATLRPGEMHTAVEPEPHQTAEMLIVEMPAGFYDPFDGVACGSLS
jgi:hypothetical protein